MTAAGILAVGVGGAATAATLASSKPAPDLKGVAGIVNAGCTQQITSSLYTVAQNGSAAACTLTFPLKEFKTEPVPVITVVGGTLTGVGISNTSTSWFITYDLSTSAPVSFSAIASN